MRSVEAGDLAPGGRADRDRAGDRDRQHLQARHPLLGAPRRDLPRRVRQGAPDRDGQLRDRPGADRRRRGRAGRRRPRDRLAALDRALAGAHRRPRQGGRREPRRRRSASTTSSPRSGVEALLDDRDAGTGREAHRRRAARLPAARHRRQADPRRGRGRDPVRGAAARTGESPSTTPRSGSRRSSRTSVRQVESGGPQTRREAAAGGFRRLIGLDRSGPLPLSTRSGQPLHPWTLPNVVGYLRLASIPVFLVVAFDSADGRSTAGRAALPVDHAGRLHRRLPRPATGQYSRLGALLDPVIDRLSALAGAAVCWHFDLLPEWALVVLGPARGRDRRARSRRAARGASTSRSAGSAGWQRSGSSGGLFWTLVIDSWVTVALFFAGLGLGIYATTLYALAGRRACVSVRQPAAGLTHPAFQWLNLNLTFRRPIYNPPHRLASDRATEHPNLKEQHGGDLPRRRLDERRRAEGTDRQPRRGRARGLLPAPAAARQDRHPARRAGQPAQGQARGWRRRRDDQRRRRRRAHARSCSARCPSAEEDSND